MCDDAKRVLRAEMRRVRQAIPDQDARSAAIGLALGALPEVRAASTVMLFDAVPGEPDLAGLTERLAAAGVRVVRPDPSPTAVAPIAPDEVDVVVVPGVAFTADGRRLGQGGGWYDRFLAGLREDATKVGVCFAAQLVDDLPTESHDVALDVVVTELGVARDR